MYKRFLPLRIMGCGAALLLAGCGGGGGGGGVPDTSTPGTSTGGDTGEPAAVSVTDNYQMFLDGSPTLTWTGTEIDARGAQLFVEMSVTEKGYELYGPAYSPGPDGTIEGGDSSEFEASPVSIEAAEWGEVFDSSQFESIMTHNGVPVVRQTEQREYGVGGSYLGILDSLVFGAGFGADSGSPETWPWIVGVWSGPNPPGPSTAEGVTWTGAVVGTNVSDTLTFENLIVGDATVRIEDLSAPAVDVFLTGLWDVEAGTQHADVSWNGLGIAGGGFTDSTDAGARTIMGTFFGPSHEEVGGVFARDGVAGAFGAKRD